MATSEEARPWHGWGTALKPAAEHWILVRKPLSEKTITANVMRWGVGGLNIDGCHIPCAPGDKTSFPEGYYGLTNFRSTIRTADSSPGGRFPANFSLSHHPECEDDCLPGCPVWELAQQHTGASRFFYCIKPSRDERGAGNHHPTVKPVGLMRYLGRMITPACGTLLDCFLGSGTTGVAAVQEGFRFIGIDRTAEYVEISAARIQGGMEEHG